MNLDDIKIKNMELLDLKKIKDILQSDFDEFWNYEIFKQELANTNSNYLVLKYNDDIFGFAGIKIIFNEADIMNIVIRKDKRNLGLGKKLLSELIVLSKTKNCNCITLEVNENNIFAINLYKSFNFENVGLRKRYYNNKDNAVIMTLYL